MFYFDDNNYGWTEQSRLTTQTNTEEQDYYKDYFNYLIEEMGEAAACLSTSLGHKNKKLKETTREEMCDVIITALGMYFQVGGNQEHLEKYIDKKLKNGKNA